MAGLEHPGAPRLAGSLANGNAKDVKSERREGESTNGRTGEGAINILSTAVLLGNEFSIAVFIHPVFARTDQERFLWNVAIGELN